MPLFNKKGYENRGYSTSTSSLVGFVFPNEEYVISKDVTIYPVYGIDNQKKNDLYSYVSRLYLDNSLNGKQINDVEIIRQNYDRFGSAMLYKQNESNTN